jgi:threonyl-tRNA synthetase
LCIHRAPLGTHERFIGFLIEHFGGDFPTWLAPEQVRILPISDKIADYAKTILAELKAAGIRVTADLHAEKLGAKIRKAELEKVPNVLIVGAKEAEEGTVSVRSRFEGDRGTMSREAFKADLIESIESRKLQFKPKAD